MLTVLERVSHRALRLAGAKTFHLNTSVARVHATELRGKGRGSYVMLHGIGTNSSSYTQVALQLARHIDRLLLIDLPGHGRSDMPKAPLDREQLAASVREALDAWIEPKSPAVLFGASLGGATAIGYALERASRVRNLVLASPAGAPLSSVELAELRARFALKTRLDARRFFSELVYRPPLYYRLLEKELVGHLSSDTVQGFLGSLQPSDFFTPQQLRGLQCPVLLVWGQSDRILPRSTLEFWRTTLPPGTVFEEPALVGHSPHLERPRWLVKRILGAAG